MSVKAKLDALPEWPTRGQKRYIQESASVGRLWIPEAVAIAYLEAAREWIAESPHKFDCNTILYDQGDSNWDGCTCDRDSLINALEAPK